MGKTDKRSQALLELLAERETLSVNEISAEFHISLPTVRKMCAALEAEGRILRIRGGVKRLPEPPNYSFNKFTQEHIEEKRRIGRYAASLLESNKTVFFETGTTVLQCAIAFAECLRNSELTNVIVFTNSLINLEALHPVCNVHFVGGRYRDERKDFTGYMSELALKGLHFDYCIIGADAISLTGGVMGMDIETVRFDRELVSKSGQVIILAHSDKLYRNSLITFASLEDTAYIVTDAHLEDAVYDQYIKKGIRLIRV